MQENVEKLRKALPEASVSVKQNQAYCHMNSINREDIFALEKTVKQNLTYVIKRSGTGMTIIVSNK